MKILLVVKSKAIETLGPQYLSAVAKQAGHECLIVALDDALPVASAYKPDLIGYSVLTGDQRRFIALNDALKRTHKFVSVFGGPHCTFFPQDFTGNSDIDLTLQGEAEQKWAELLGSDKKYPDLDSIPWADRTDFKNRPIRDFLASRGCVGKCRYCFSDRFAKMFPELPRVRYRSVKDVVAEVNSVDPEFVYFQDSCFGVNIKWLREFSKQYHRDANIRYHCHLRPDQCTEERVLLLHDSGCFSVRIALETASDRLRKMIGREKTTNKETVKAAWMLKKWDIKLMIQNILCLPESTIEDDLQTLEINIQCQPSYGWSSIFAPFPGTELGDLCVEKGLFTGDYDTLSDSFFDKSVLNISEEYREQSYYLQKCFALAVETQCIPEVEELTEERFPGLVHRLMRKLGDHRLYDGIL